MMMSYADAIEFINPAYNPDVASFFPQPRHISSTPSVTDSSVTSINEIPLDVAPEGFCADNDSDRTHAVIVLEQKSIAKAVRCEICSISCNSKKMLEKHVVGKKHRKKAGEKNLNSSMADNVKTDENMEDVGINSVKNIEIDGAESLPRAGLEEMCKTSGVSHGTQAMPKPSSTKVLVDDTCKSKEVDDEFVADKKLSNPVKAYYSADLMLDASNAYPVVMAPLECASRPCIRVCTVCNIFSNSEAALEKHLAGKTHARKVIYLNTVMSSASLVSVYPVESDNSKTASDAINRAGSSSLTPVVATEIQENIHSEGGTVISLPLVCTVCNIKCNSEDIYKNHLSGRKHASKVRMLVSSIHTPSTSTKDHSANERASKRGKIVQFAYCDVCKIYCNSSEILDKHKMGKKHMKQLEKLGSKKVVESPELS